MAPVLFELPHMWYCTSYMFGKNHKRNLQIMTAILGIVVIVSMILSYFSLLV
jgi:hypothetical protein